MLREFNGGTKNRQVCVAIYCEHILIAGVAGGRICVVNCLVVLVFSLTVVEYFSKRVVNDVIKLEVSTGVGIFFGFVHLVSKVIKKKVLKSYIQAIHSKDFAFCYRYL